MKMVDATFNVIDLVLALGNLGVLGVAAPYFFRKISNSVTKEEMKEYVNDTVDKNIKLVGLQISDLKENVTYIRERVDQLSK